MRAPSFLRRGSSLSAAHVTADDVEAFTHDTALARWGDEMVANTVMAAR